LRHLRQAHRRNGSAGRSKVHVARQGARSQDLAQRPGKNSFSVQSGGVPSLIRRPRAEETADKALWASRKNGFQHLCKAGEFLPGDAAYKFSINFAFTEYSQILTCPPRRLGYIPCRERDDKVPHAEQSRHLARHHTLVMSAICVLVAGSQRFAGLGTRQRDETEFGLLSIATA
jgi:hypothetical protein